MIALWLTVAVCVVAVCDVAGAPNRRFLHPMRPQVQVLEAPGWVYLDPEVDCQACGDDLTDTCVEMCNGGAE
jgi:hypothetical protein